MENYLEKENDARARSISERAEKLRFTEEDYLILDNIDKLLGDKIRVVIKFLEGWVIDNWGQANEWWFKERLTTLDEVRRFIRELKSPKASDFSDYYISPLREAVSKAYDSLKSSLGSSEDDKKLKSIEDSVIRFGR
jgi:hypothetical protein